MERILIKKVRENEVLYNAKSTYYRDSEVRQQTWQKIGKELNLRPEEARCTWDKLRRCFINARNRRRIKEHECGITIHPWKYEKDMSFLWPFVERNRRTFDFAKSDENTTFENHDSESEDMDKDINLSVDNINQVKAEAEEIQNYDSPITGSISCNGNDDMPTLIVEPPIGYKRLYPLDGDPAERMDYKIKSVPKEHSILQMDESDLFFISMSKMTKSLPILERAKVKLAVSNAVLQALIAAHQHIDPS